MLREYVKQLKKVPRLRSVFSVPASNDKMVQKCLTRQADLVVLDLEDGVAQQQKPQARQNIVNFLQDKESNQLAVRINALNTEDSVHDIGQLGSVLHKISTIVMPKAEMVEEIEALDRLVTRFSQLNGKKLNLLAALESPAAILQAAQISKAQNLKSLTLQGLIFASEDYTVASRVKRTDDLSTFTYPRSRLQCVASAHGLAAIDLVCIDTPASPRFKEQLAFECVNGRNLGYQGKQCIHPAQIEAINEAFAPSSEEVKEAQTIWQLYQEHAEKGTGAFEYKGKVVDMPVVRDVLKILVEAQVEVYPEN